MQHKVRSTVSVSQCLLSEMNPGSSILAPSWPSIISLLKEKPGFQEIILSCLSRAGHKEDVVYQNKIYPRPNCRAGRSANGQDLAQVPQAFPEPWLHWQTCTQYHWLFKLPTRMHQTPVLATANHRQIDRQMPSCSNRCWARASNLRGSRERLLPRAGSEVGSKHTSH